MATSAGIHYVKGKRLYSIYNHFDGYLDYVGNILYEHYQDEKKVKRLINLGSISTLGERVEPLGNTHKLETPEDGTTVAYHRDRGDSKLVDVRDIEETSVIDLLIYVADLTRHDYNYVYFGNEKKWYFVDGDDGYGTLAEVLGKPEINNANPKPKRFITKENSVKVARELRKGKDKVYVIFINTDGRPVGRVFNKRNLQHLNEIIFGVSWESFQKELNKRPTQGQLAEYVYRRANQEVNAKEWDLG